MRWEAWVIAFWFVLGPLLAIGQIGKARKPIEPSTCVVGLVISIFFVWLAVRLGTA